MSDPNKNNISPPMDQHIHLEVKSHAEQALLECEDRFRNLFETISQGVIYFDPSGRILSANPAAKKILGITLDPAKTYTFRSPDWRIMREDGSDLWDDEHPFTVACRTGQRVDPIVMILHNPITRFHQWLSVSAIPLFHPGEGKPYQVISTFEDITEARVTKMAIEDGREKYRQFFNQSSEGICLIDEGGHIIEWNSAMERLTGIYYAQAVGKYFMEIQTALFPSPPDAIFSEEQKRRVGQLLLTGRADFLNQVIEISIKNMNGEIHIVQQMTFPIKTNKGYQIGLTAHDITKRKQAEGTLRESEEKYRMLFENMSEGFSLNEIITDENGQGMDIRILDANAAYERHIGFKPSEVIGRTVREVTGKISPDQIERYAEVVRTGKPLTTEFFSTILKRHFRMKVFCPQPGRYASIVEDISERKEMEEELRVSEERFSAIYQNSPAAISISDPRDDSLVDVNNAFMSLFGYERQELIGNTLASLNLWVDQGQLKNELRPLSGEKSLRELEVKLRAKDGTVHDVLISSELIETGDTPLRITIGQDITEKKRAEVRIAAMAQRYQTLLNTATDGIHILDSQGNVVEVNTAFCEMLGYSQEEMLRLNVADWDTQWPKEELLDKIQSLFQQPALFETVHRRKDGVVIQVEINATRVLLDGQNFLYAAARDITERKRVEENLRESEARFREVIENSLDASYKRNLKTNTYEYFSPVLEKVSGYSPEEFINLPLEDTLSLIHPNDLTRIESILADALNSPEGASHQIQYRLKHKQGHFLWLRDQFIVKRDETGQPAAIIGSISDITERKEAEDALRESEARWQFALEGAGEGVWDWEAQTDRVFFSNQWKAILGFEPGEIGNTLSEWDQRVHPDDKAYVYGEIEKHFSGQTPIYTSEHRVQSRDGSYKWILDRGKVISRTPDGKPLRVIGTHTDITERKLAEQKLRESEALFSTVFNASPAAIGLVRRSDQRFLRANPAFETLSGFKSTELTSITSQETNLWVEPKKREYYFQTMNSVGRLRNFEHKFRHRDGHLMDMIISAERVHVGGEECILTIGQDITEIKRIEAELRESRAKLQAIIDASPIPIGLNDEFQHITYLNRAFVETFGYTTEDIQTLDQWALLAYPDPEYRQWVFEMRKERHAQNQSAKIHLIPLELEVRCKDGSHKTVLLSSSFLSDKFAGEQLVVFYDITERKFTEEALLLSEQKFRALAENTPNVVFLCKNDTRYSFLYLNNAIEQLTGYLKEEFLDNGLTFFDLYHPDDLHLIPLAHEGFEVTKDRKPFHITYRIRRRSGEIRWVDEWGTGIITPEGQVESFMGVMIDITDRKKAEAEILAQRDFATQIVNLMGQGLTVTNAEGRFEFVNQAYASLFGYEPADLIGKKPKDVTVAEEHATLQDQLQQRMAGLTSTYESQLLRKDGSIAQVLITGVARKSMDGKYAGTIAVITDLTEEKRVQHELKAAKAALEKALELEKNLSHTDELTGIHNRRHLFELAERKVAVANRYKQPLAVMMFDIDHFKNINDTYGHATGDEVLKSVAQITRSELREADIFGRYGGEEFILLLPMTTAQQAFTLAERIRTQVAALRTPSDKGEVSITLSIGVIELNHSTKRETAEDIFRRADIAMYAAKATGRNCTVVLDSNLQTGS
ncbi:MAG TPA: PAS domain S-box protein [Anaerolineales bacterium]|nr:PAS domain S-box protein [Anaerolineales bacterium]HNO30334.1 PAS domain S-box protein [Anaerolineales bacterium]